MATFDPAKISKIVQLLEFKKSTLFANGRRVCTQKQTSTKIAFSQQHKVVVVLLCCVAWTVLCKVFVPKKSFKLASGGG